MSNGAVNFTDSQATFNHKCLQAGLSEEHVRKMRENGIATLGLLAFATSYQPGSSTDDKPFLDLAKALF
eukprot:247568-Amphidinium_carterae.1